MEDVTEDTNDDKATRFKEKHSLDSDEEDDGKKYDVLAEDEIEGQEDATIDYDEDIQITPFNMKEEMEEGHFDTDGTYIFDKTKEIKDSWMDNIDWVKVKHLNSDETSKKRPFQYSDSSDEEEESEAERQKNTKKLYEEILSILLNGETVAKAIRRLAKNKSKIPSASQRWKNKKAKTGSKTTQEDQEAIDQAVAEQKQMLHLTELCDLLVQRGIVDIYETPYERIAFTLKQMKEKDKGSRLTIAEGMKDDDALDMFAEDFDSKEAGKMKGAGEDADKPSETPSDFKKPQDPGGSSNGTSALSSSSQDSDKESELMWEYKESDGEEIKGPFTTSQMLKWSDDGTFGKGVLCRKVKTQGQFYNSARLDFELYQ